MTILVMFGFGIVTFGFGKGCSGFGIVMFVHRTGSSGFGIETIELGRVSC